jgi:hypothetical protein
VNLDRFVDDVLALPVRERGRFLRAAARGVAVPPPEPIRPRSRRRSAAEPPCRCPQFVTRHSGFPAGTIVIVVPPALTPG